MLTALVAAPDEAIGALPVEAPADRQRQLHDWQPAATPLPAAASVYSQFAAAVLKTPAALAGECKGQRQSYAAHAARVLEIARQLIAAGCTAAEPVALCLPRSIDMLAAVLAVWRVGGWYLPLDPGLPAPRLHYLLQDSGVRLLVTAGGQGEAIAGFAGTVLALSTGGDVGALPGLPVPDPATSRPAYLIYTSGSTGQPKGVVVPQAAVLNFLLSMAIEPGLVAGDRLLAVTTLSFDIAVLELLLPLIVGATVVLATEDEAADPVVLAGLLETRAITVMQATPSAWRNLLNAGWPGHSGGHANLRLLCGGEALDHPLASRLAACGAELWNLYGPTETTIWSCVERIEPAALAADPRPPVIGRPIANTRCYVLDEQERPVPIGAHGELWIAGAGVALGYHGQAALTARRFRPDPFVADGVVAGRMYRTGDQARWRGDGRLELLGRLDRQLKLRGYRIEPGEIEAVLLTHAAIHAAAVVLQDINGDPRLIAYLANLQTPVPDSDLVGMLEAVLPRWMIPSRFIWLEQLPLTPNGKLDRQALPPVSVATPVTGSASLTTGEQALADLFAGLLGTPVGPDDDFFARGGHSLLATRLIARIRADFGVALPLRTLFESPSVRTLAAVLATAGATIETTAKAPAVASNPTTTHRAPLSLVQQRLWFLDRLQPGNSVYHLAWACELRGPLDRAALQTALNGLVARHGALRTCFPEHDGMPGQAIAPTGTWPLQIVSGEAAAVEQLLADAVTAPFRLATGPLVKALLIETGHHHSTLLLVVHHIVADGWSLGILSRELATLYAAARGDVATVALDSLPGPGRTYADYANEQRRLLAGGELQRQLAWWQTTLKDAPPFLDLPTARPRPTLGSARGSRLPRLLTVERQAALHALANAEGCTFFMVVLAAMDVLLARYTGTDDVVVGTPVAGRPDHDLEALVGFFINTLVLRTRLAGNPPVRELLHRVRETTLAAFENADVPFELLVETLQPPRSTNRPPLFQVLFTLHNEPGTPLTLPGLEVRPVAVPRHTTKFDLGISLTETPVGLSITIEYNRDLFLPESIKRFIADYDIVLAGFIAAPGARLGDLPCSPREMRASTAATGHPEPDTTLPAAFAAVVAQSPEALAVRAPALSGPHGTQPAIEWSYAELAREAAQVAAVLARHRVQPGDRVALWFGHGAGQVAAILGVLQAGAIYVPLDPLAPAARLRRIVDDAGAVLVLRDRWAPDWPVTSLDDKMVCLPKNIPATDEPAPVPATTAGDPEALAYLLYTSGSTGTPKGVPQTHRNVLHHVRAWAGNLGLVPGDRLSLLSTYGYDAAVQDIFGALLHGAAVCPLDIRHLDRESLLDRIADWGLSVLHATPSVYRYLFGGHVACRQDLSRIRLLVLGGEPARRADFELYRARFAKAARFINGYGLTEATAVTQWFAGPHTHPYGQQLPIGRPLAEGTLRLLDEEGEPAAFAGEVVLDARTLTPGYWSATDQRPATADERWFHTGDLARVLPDGNLVFIGRRDERVKIGGIRVEPAEIELALCSHPAVSEAAVLPRLSPAGAPELVAYHGLRPAAEAPSPAALRAHLATLLPAALLPAYFQPCATLPRLPNGKLDRATLRAAPLPGPAADVRAPGVATATGLDARQKVLMKIWQGLLQRNDIGLDDDFFVLGGHSLLATRLVARIRDRLGVEVPLIRVFEAPTIRGLADTLYNADAGPGHRAAVVVPSGS